MGETVHTAFRKGADGKESAEIWNAIRKMPKEQWGDAVEWMCWALAYSLKNDLIIKNARKRWAQGKETQK